MKLLSTDEVTKIVGRNRGTLYKWWKMGIFPEPLLYNGRALGWNEDDVQQWLNKKEQS
jgi:prophage regulatory protein